MILKVWFVYHILSKAQILLLYSMNLVDKEVNFVTHECLDIVVSDSFKPSIRKKRNIRLEYFNAEIIIWYSKINNN